MDDLPELPLEKVLSYLSLEEVIKLRTVSRSCLWKIDNYKVKHLFYSRVPTGHILEKRRWISGAFAQNFIVSTRFESFFKTFGRSILSHLKHLRLYDLDPQTESSTAFTDALNSFRQLEELDLIGKSYSKKSHKRRELELNLPMLKSVLFEHMRGIEKVTLDAPMLKKVKIGGFRPRLFLDLVHGESVESLLVDHIHYVKLESLKNLKTIYIGPNAVIDFPLLFGLEQLKAIHLIGDNDVRELFDLKQRQGRDDLQVYRLGCLLSGPDLPPTSRFYLDDPYGGSFPFLAANPSRMADQMPFWFSLSYCYIEDLAPQSQATILNRLTGLVWLSLEWPIFDIDRFLDFLKTFNIESLQDRIVMPQEQFDRLPEHSDLQKLHITVVPSDLEFLFRLKKLVYLSLRSPIGTETIRRALEELPLLEYFKLLFGPNETLCEIRISIETPKRFKVYIDGKKLHTRDLNAVIQFTEQTITGEVGDMEGN